MLEVGLCVCVCIRKWGKRDLLSNYRDKNRQRRLFSHSQSGFFLIHVSYNGISESVVNALWLICQSHCDALKWACHFWFGPFQTKPHRICVCSCVWEAAIQWVNKRQWLTFIWFKHITFKHTSPQSFIFLLAIYSSEKQVNAYVSWWFTRK